MLLGFVLVLIYCQHDKYVRMCEILNILYLAHFERFHRLIWIEKLHFHLVYFQHNQGISKRRDHDIDIVLTNFLFRKHDADFLAKVIHKRILKHFLKLVFILVLKFVKFHLLLKLLWVYLLDDTIVLLQINVKLGGGWSLTVQGGDLCVCEVVIFL